MFSALNDLVYHSYSNFFFFFRTKGDKGEPGGIGPKGVPGEYIYVICILLIMLVLVSNDYIISILKYLRSFGNWNSSKCTKTNVRVNCKISLEITF